MPLAISRWYPGMRVSDAIRHHEALIEELQGLVVGSQGASLVALQQQLNQVEARVSALEAGDSGPGVVYDKTATLTDEFTTNLNSWVTQGSATLNQDGQLVLVPTALSGGAYTTWIQRGPYDLSSSSIYIPVDQAGSGATTEAGLELRLDANNYIAFFVTNGLLYSRLRSNGVNDDENLGAWDSTTQRYIRVRHEAGNIEWHVGSDGSTWNSALRTETEPSWAIDAVLVRLFAGYYGTESAPGTALFSSVNVVNAKPTSGGGGGSTAPTWSGAADNGLLGDWEDIHDGAHDSQFGSSTLVSIVSSPVLLSGHDAFQFESQAGSASNGPRAELADFNPKFSEGEEWWFGDILRTDSAVWQSGNHTVMQWKNDGTGSPPIQLDIREWGNSDSGLGAFIVGIGFEPLIPMASLANTNHQIEVYIKFSSSASVGRMTVYLGGASSPTLDVPCATLYEGITSYFKQGQYGNQASNRVWWLGALRGTSRASVLPGNR